MPAPSKPTYQAARRSRWLTVGRWLIADPWRKLIALGLAIGCWCILHKILPSMDNRSWETIPGVPVTIESDGQLYLVPQSLTPREVTLAVAVDIWRADHFGVKDFRIRLDTHRLNFTNDGLRTQPLEYTYDLQEADLLEKPEGVALRGFQPDTVTFQWDRRIYKQVPVQPRLRKRLPPTLACTVRETPQVTVSGPAYLVNQVTHVETEDILLEQDSPGVVPLPQVRLKLPGQFASLTMDPQVISAKIEITDNQQVQSRVIKDVRLHYLTSLDSALVVQNAAQLPRAITLYVAGPAGVLEGLDPGRLMGLCDLTAYSMPGPQDVPVQVMNLHPEVRVTRMLPAGPIRVELVAPHTP